MPPQSGYYSFTTHTLPPRYYSFTTHTAPSRNYTPLTTSKIRYYSPNTILFIHHTHTTIKMISITRHHNQDTIHHIHHSNTFPPTHTCTTIQIQFTNDYNQDKILFTKQNIVQTAITGASFQILTS